MRRGFTLIEILIASGLFAMVSVVGATTLTSIYKVENTTEIKRAAQQSVRLPLETIARDVRLAKSIESIESDNSGFTIITQDNQKVKYSINPTTHKINKTEYPITPGSINSLTGDNIKVEAFKVYGAETLASVPYKHSFVNMTITVSSLLDTNVPPAKLEASALAVPRGYKK